MSSPLLLTALVAMVLIAPTAADLPLRACQLPNGPISHSDVALGFPRIANRMRPTGVVNFTLLFLDFSDAPTPDPPGTVFARVAPAADYYRNLSRGVMQPLFSPLLITIRMSKPSRSYTITTEEGQRAYLTEATQLAVSLHNWDFSTSDSVVAMASTAATALPNGPAFCAEPGGGFVASGKIFENSATSGHDFTNWGSGWFNHEVGHTMGLVDLYSFAGGAEFRFTGDWSLMGNIAGKGNEYTGWERWLLSWVADAEVVCVDSAPRRVLLTPIESPDATPAGHARMAVAVTDQYTSIVLEARGRVGHDTGLPQPGVLVYRVNTNLATGNGPLQVLSNGTATSNMLTSTLTPGSEMTHDGVRVVCVSVDADGSATVDISSACTAFNCPAPSTCVNQACIAAAAAAAVAA